jgi:hypothetical protein
MKFPHYAKWMLALIPLAVYILLLSFGAPQGISRFFQIYSPALFLIALCLNYLVLSRNDSGRSLLLFTITLVLFALPLVFLWSTAYSDNKVFAGFLPYKDGKNYYVASQKILNGFPAGGSSQGTWRPLTPGLLSSLLLFTNGSLQWTLALLALLTAVALYVSARQVIPELGLFAAAYYFTLAYLYIRPWLGYTMSEIPGFIFGCLGFALIWKYARSGRSLDLAAGLFLLTTGISARAGAFFIFPALALWAGWIRRGEKRFSFSAFAFVTAVFIVSLFIVSWLYPRSLGITESAQGNFAYTIYGQVRGGIGWQDSVRELNTSKINLVYREALAYFLRHPLSLLIGALKSYRDFFVPNYSGIFGSMWNNSLFDTFLWILNLVLLGVGLFKSVKQIHSPHASLALAGFAGIFFSIPFLPPIDGGSRFHASTMPFFLIIPALALRSKEKTAAFDFVKPIYALSFILSFLTILLPPVTQRLANKVELPVPECREGQTPFAIHVFHGSYLDLQPDSVKSCGYLPNACISGFRANGAERGIDDFFDQILEMAESSNAPMRLTVSYNLLNDRMYYFIGRPDQLQEGLLTGCASNDVTGKQRMLIVEP